MSSYNGFLVRDSLDDTGVIPSPGYPYHSPDMINHDQVQDPQSFFSANYNTDPNSPLEAGYFNYIYVRAKNLSSNTLSASMSCYWTRTSLVMHPDQWMNQCLSTAAGASSVDLPSTVAGGIAVASQPFAWRPPSDSKYGYCMIGRIFSETNPNPIPTNFSSWNDFVTWVKTNQDICWRNLTILDNYPDPQWDQLALFQNITSESVPILFSATASDNVPVGTTMTLKCDALNINKSQTITSESSSRILTTSSICPANYLGSIETMALIPNGANWPMGATITTKSYVGQDGNDDIARWAMDHNALFLDEQDKNILGLHDDGVLVEIGNTTTEFNRTS